MDANILSVLELVRPTLPPSLIDAEGYAHLAAIATQLPEPLTTFWGFECRLGLPAARADILFETKKQSRGQALLAGKSSSALDALCETSPTWQRLRAFANVWANPAHLFASNIRNLWLEFDTAGVATPNQAAALVHSPSVFLGPDAPTLSRAALFDLLREAFAILGYADPSIARLPSFIAALPPDAKLFQVGMMLARSDAGLRVCVKDLAAADLAHWLAQAGWQGDPAWLAELTHTIIPMLETWTINLGFTPAGLAEKIGLECYLDWLEDDSQQWVPLLDSIVARGLCLPQKRQGVLDFPGVTLTPPSASTDAFQYLNLFRKIHHLKLNFSAGQIREAKAYFALTRPGVYLDRPHPERDDWLIE